MTNTGSSSARNIVATDPLPAATSFVAGSMRSGPGCADATVAEDDNAAGGDENDPIGASFANGTVEIRAAELARGQAAAVTFETLIK